MSNVSVANGSTSDPREQDCWDYYVESITAGGKGNAMQAALKAGYSDDHARNITIQGWFVERLEKLKRKDLLSKAEKCLHKTLDYNPEEEGKIRTDLLRIQADIAKFITSTQGKDKGYSNRTELTDGDGKPLQPVIVKFINGNDD